MIRVHLRDTKHKNVYSDVLHQQFCAFFFMIKDIGCIDFHMLFLIFSDSNFPCPLQPAKIDGFCLCICICGAYAVEPAFDLHMFSELLL